MDIANNDRIFIGYGDDTVELLGDAKTEFIAERNRMDAEKAEALAKANMKKVAALAKLEALGLTTEDLSALGL